MSDPVSAQAVSGRSPLENTVALGDGRVRLVWAGARTEREAAEIRRQVSAQSEAIREAAEREAAALRAAVIEMAAGLGGMVSVTGDQINSAKLVSGSQGQVAAQPAVRPAVRPAAEPRPRPGTGTKGRQVRAKRKVQVAFVALFLIGVTSGASEIAIHGFSFFLFRNTGAGAGNSRNLNENQGPGQPDAPGAHHSISPKKVP